MSPLLLSLLIGAISKSVASGASSLDGACVADPSRGLHDCKDDSLDDSEGANFIQTQIRKAAAVENQAKTQNGSSASTANLTEKSTGASSANQTQISIAAENQTQTQNGTDETGSNPQMDDVLAAFSAMMTIGAKIDINKGSDFPIDGYNNYIPPYSAHFQGIQRLRPKSGASTFLAMTGSCHTAGNLFIAEIKQAAASGPLVPASTRGNAFAAFNPFKAVLSGSVVTVVNVSALDDALTHTGGPAVWGNVLAVGVEAGCQTMMECPKKSKVIFYDVSDPLSLQKLPYFIDRPTLNAGAVGLVQQANGKFLLVVGDVDSAVLDFYVSSTTSGDLLTDPGWHQVASWKQEELLVKVGLLNYYLWYHNLNLVVQKDGTIFMIGSSRSPMAIGRDYFELFTVQPSESGVQVAKVASRAMVSHGCDFNAAAAIYVDSATSMLGYCSGWLPGNPYAPDAGVIHLNEF
ncbi:unnamed protein product [Polarella glacialis]|uniref:Uncharacterized protein n=1 Tax=Polarella glacialis TaxID=89957 RepID=A0A813M152_POLGL|nr:unnamed protein product [Polarella glacialis]